MEYFFFLLEYEERLRGRERGRETRARERASELIFASSEDDDRE